MPSRSSSVLPIPPSLPLRAFLIQPMAAISFNCAIRLSFVKTGTLPAASVIDVTGCARLLVVGRDVDADKFAIVIDGSDRRRPRPHEGIENDLRGRGTDDAIDESNGKCCRMRVRHFLREFPDIAMCIRFWRQFELRLCDQVDDFIGGKKVSGVEIEPALALPNDDLSNREASDDILAILQKSVLDTPFVVVKNRAVFRDHPHHLRKTAALPAHILVMRHAIMVM